MALTTRRENDAELLSAEDADVPLRWRLLLEFYDHRETRIRASAQVVFAGVVDSHRAQQDVDAHNENFMDPQASLELPCPVRRWVRAERALLCLEQHFGIQLVEYERNMSERMRQEVGANRAEVTSALETVAANNVQLVAQGNVAFEQRYRACARRCAWNSTATVHTLPWRHRRTFLPTLRLASLRFAISSWGSSIRVATERNNMPAEHGEMFAAALREEAHRELISVKCSSDR